MIIHRVLTCSLPRHVLFEQRGHRVLQRGVQDGADGGGRGDGEEGEERLRQAAVAEAAVPGRGGVPTEAAQDQGRVNPRRLTGAELLVFPQAKIHHYHHQKKETTA